MPTIPGVPFSPIPATGTPNPDLPPTQMPSLPRITVLDLVGPDAANRQHKSLEKRDETLRSFVNNLLTAINAVGSSFLQRDGGVQSDSTSGIQGNMPMNGFRFTGMGASATNGQAVEHSQLVAESVARAAADAGLTASIATKAPLASPALTGTPTAPTASAGTNTTQVATTEFVQTALSAISPLPIPTHNIEGDGTTVLSGGVYYFNNLNISTAVVVGKHVKIICAGTFTISPGGSITSNHGIEIEAKGAVLTDGPIYGIYVSIRSDSTVTINSPVQSHQNAGTTTAYYKFAHLGVRSRPAPDQVALSPHLDVFRPIIIECASDLVTGPAGTLTADDVFIKSGANITFGARVHAVVYAPISSQAWFDGFITNDSTVFGRGGNGGTAGGWVNTSGSGKASYWRGTNKPLFLHTYDLARGSTGRSPDGGYQGSPGGRCHVFARGNITATGTQVSARGLNADGGYGVAGSPGGSGEAAGGGGVVRGVAGGTITGGTWDAGGGRGNGGNEHGAGGGVLLLAAVYTSVTTDVGAASEGQPGTVTQVTSDFATIMDIARRGIFDVFPPLNPIRY